MSIYRYELNLPVYHEGLDAEMRASFNSAIAGLNGKKNSFIEIVFVGTPTQGDLDNADAILNAHDPAFLTSDKRVIDNSGTDVATIDIWIPRNVNNAIAIVATIEGLSTSPLVVTNNHATLEIDGLDLIDGDTIEVGVVGFTHETLVIGVIDGE